MNAKEQLDAAREKLMRWAQPSEYDCPQCSAYTAFEIQAISAPKLQTDLDALLAAHTACMAEGEGLDWEAAYFSLPNSHTPYVEHSVIEAQVAAKVGALKARIAELEKANALLVTDGAFVAGEVVRLRALAEHAYCEGYEDGGGHGGNDADLCWPGSKSFTALQEPR